MKKLLLILTVLFFFSCKKDDFHKESFSGIVLHTVTRQPLINQEVSLLVTSITVGKKDIEFPDGRPIYTTKRYTSRTDNNGTYTFNFEVSGEWTFAVELITGSFIQKIPLKNIHFIVSSFDKYLTVIRDTYDTIYGEKPGYIRYHVNNINDSHDNDTLLALANSQIWIKSPILNVPFIYNEYNWAFLGKPIDTVILDTLPAESNQLIPIKWLHKRLDTIVFKNENISILPNTTTDYNIHY